MAQNKKDKSSSEIVEKDSTFSNLQNKVRNIYNFIGENLYFSLPDIKVGDKQFNSTLLFEVLTCLNGGKQMLFGEYGLGKTTSSEQVAALVDGIPRQVVLASEIKGHPEQTEEKMVGRPDLGQLNQGVEQVIWSYFVLNKTKIVDEFNRLPASKQNVLLDGLDRGAWKYLSDIIQVDNFSLFATCNYEDLGNSKLIEPILDRFDLATESKRPSMTQFSSIKDLSADIKNIVDDSKIADEIFDIYDSKDLDYAAKKSKVEGVSAKYRANIKQKCGLELLTETELSQIREGISKVKFTSEAELFYTFVISELSSCQQYGMKRANESCSKGCHFSEYGCSKVQSGLSVRSAQAISKYSKSLAWIQEKSKVDVEEIEKVLPFAIWHKVKFDPKYLASFTQDSRTDPIELYAAKKMTQEIKKRFLDQMPSIKQYVALMRDGKEEDAAKYIEAMDHPVFKEFSRVSWNSN